MKDCQCGAPLRSDSLRCAQCGVAFTLDKSQVGVPDDVAITHDWDSALVSLADSQAGAGDSMTPSGPSAASLREVRRQSRWRQIKRFFAR